MFRQPVCVYSGAFDNPCHADPLPPFFPLYLCTHSLWLRLLRCAIPTCPCLLQNGKLGALLTCFMTVWELYSGRACALSTSRCHRHGSPPLQRFHFSQLAARLLWRQLVPSHIPSYSQLAKISAIILPHHNGTCSIYSLHRLTLQATAPNGKEALGGKELDCRRHALATRPVGAPNVQVCKPDDFELDSSILTTTFKH